MDTMVNDLLVTGATVVQSMLAGPTDPYSPEGRQNRIQRLQRINNPTPAQSKELRRLQTWQTAWPGRPMDDMDPVRMGEDMGKTLLEQGRAKGGEGWYAMNYNLDFNPAELDWGPNEIAGFRRGLNKGLGVTEAAQEAGGEDEEGEEDAGAPGEQYQGVRLYRQVGGRRVPVGGYEPVNAVTPGGGYRPSGSASDWVDYQRMQDTIAKQNWLAKRRDQAAAQARARQRERMDELIDDYNMEERRARARRERERKQIKQELLYSFASAADNYRRNIQSVISQQRRYAQQGRGALDYGAPRRGDNLETGAP